MNERGEESLEPKGVSRPLSPELRVLGEEVREMPAGLGHRWVPDLAGLEGLEPSAHFCRVKFSDKNFSRPTLLVHLGTRCPNLSTQSKPIPTGGLSLPPAASCYVPFYPVAF